MTRCLILLALPATAFAATTYTAEKTTDHGVEVVRLADTARAIEVLIVPSFGYRAYGLKVHGKNLLYFPLLDPAAFKDSRQSGLSGIPFLAPWANRIAGGGFWSDGKRYLFNAGLGTLR
ncbi:MAG: aldose 1-epimerase, partial [Acidobacteriaceae bacterium]|nr:aldose 1-epimerase [Acidobacteriaceae bacterium]